jgi:hypothetical protein
MPATATGRGAQVILDGDAQKAARGAYAPTLVANSRYLESQQKSGAVADGSTPDGTTITGAPAEDYIVDAPGAGLYLPLTGGTVQTVFSDPTVESIATTFVTATSLTADNPQDIINVLARYYPNTGGHHMTSFHGSAIYAVGTPFDNVPGGTIDGINAVMAQSGNQGKGTVTRAVDFYGHANVNNAGGVLTNHYFLFQEGSTGAVNHYGAFFSAPVGIGTPTPIYNLDVQDGGGNTHGNWFRAGNLSVTSNGASIYPGFNPGPGGFGVQDLIVGNNGAAEATTSSASFLYISSCAGTPTGFPAQAATGRVAMRYDTTAHKLWMHDGTSWRGVVLT